MNSTGPEVRDSRTTSALQEFLESLDRGEPFDREAFLFRHAEIADQLRSFINDSDDLARRVADGVAAAAVEVSTNQSVSETLQPGPAGPSPELPPQFGRYVVQKLLGRGAMGAVYLAQDTQLSRSVALKVPHFNADDSGELLQRFYREARAAAMLRSPHICPVYDVGEIDGQHYISMAFIDGRPLSDLIRSKQPLTERQILLLIRRLALALQEAHDQGIIHRDLKPGNVMIDTRGEPVVTDFGLACQTRDDAARLTSPGVVLGSPAYMSPEQLEGNAASVTAAADQYALGVMLYELLTGELPFRGSIPAVINQIASKLAPSPGLLRPGLDSRIEAMCLRMLSKTAGARFESMQAVADHVVAILKSPAAAELPPRQSERNPPAMPTQSKNIQRKVREEVEQLDGIPKLCLLAAKLIRKHDYSEARRVLSSVPKPDRTEELNDLLQDATDKEDESAQLLRDIELAIRENQERDLPRLVKRFLQLKPGNQAVQTLAAELNEYGAGRVIRIRRGRRNVFDPAGPAWSRRHVVYCLGGLALLFAAVYGAAMAFQTPRGTVIVEVHDPGITISFADDEITATSGERTYKLKTTEKKTLQLSVDGVGVESATREITVSNNETKLISARLVDGELDLLINSEKKVFAVPEKAVAARPQSTPAPGPATPTDVEVVTIDAQVPKSPPPPEVLPQAAPAAATAGKSVLLDVDFRMTDGGFTQADEHHILSEHRDGEYRYMGKKVGWWYSTLHPLLWRSENRLRDFALEIDVRLVGARKGLFAIEFGRTGEGSLSLCLNEAGKLLMLRGNDQVFVPLTESPAMRPVDQFNTLRLVSENKMVRVFVNGTLAIEKPVEHYAEGFVSIWLGPEEVPFDSRLRKFRLERLGPPATSRYSEEVRRLKGHTDIVRGISFLPDGQRAVSVGHSAAFKLWDVNQGELLFDFAGHPNNVTSVSVSGDGRRALTGCDDGRVRLWDLENRKLVKTLDGQETPVVSVLISTDGQEGLAATLDGKVRRWNLKTGKPKLLPGPDAGPTLAISPDQKMIAAGNANGNVFVRGPQGVTSLVGHTSGIIGGVAFSPEGSKLATGARDGTVRIWDIAQGKELHRFDTDSIGFDAVAITKDGRHVIAGSGDHTICSWDLQTGKQDFVLRARTPVMHRMALSPDNQYILSGGGDQDWRLMNDFDLRLWRRPISAGEGAD
jgi:serine/threonine protein kinase/WD40 repeat protein